VDGNSVGKEWRSKKSIMSKAFSLSIMSLFLTLHGWGQLTVYKTYADYKNNTGAAYDASYKYLGIKGSDGIGYVVDFESKGKPRLSIHCGNVWGFKYQDRIFRTAESTKAPAALTFTGKMCFYVNGYSVLKDMNVGGYASKAIKESESNYISKDMQSDVVVWPIGNPDYLASVIKKIEKEYPETTPLLDCIYNNKDSYLKMKDCIKQYNTP
jgi:hypothetical protein